jgi:hypothetical protein
MFRDTIGIVFDEAGDVTQYMTKRLTSFGSRFSIAVEQITSSSTIIFPSLQSLACSASFKADDITRTTTIEGKMGPGDPGATMSRVCGMKMIHEDCDYHAPGDPPVTTEVFCQVP